MTMPPTTTELIKDKLDIVEFLRGYVELRPAGKNFKALCPFHREKTPSFMVSPERQSWHCFGGCNTGGDIFGFLMRRENIEFGDALRILAERAGVELRRANPAEYKLIGLLHELNSVAKDYYREQLAGAPDARRYLSERGLRPDTIDTFELGFAPNVRDGLTLYLARKRYAPEDILRAGLALQTEGGLRLDRFRGRLMFPVHDHFGKCVGFTGRVLPQFETGEGMNSAKYLNSPETPVYSKSRILYGFHLTKNNVREAGWAFLVEGQMDLVMSYQAGVRNVAAASGTALSTDHLRTLRRTTDRLKVCFDMDAAGADAAERGIELAEAADFSVDVVRLGKHKDPADAAAADPDALRRAIAAAVPAPEFYFEKYLRDAAFEKTGPSRSDRRDRTYITNVRAVLAKLNALASPVDRDHWMRELARRLGTNETALREEAERLKTDRAAARPAARTETEGAAELLRLPSRRELLSERLVAACYARNDPSLLGTHAEYLVPDYRAVLDLLARGESRSGDARLDELMNLAILRAGDADDKELDELKNYLFVEYVQDRRRELIDDIKRAENSGDEEGLLSAYDRFNSLPAL